MTFTAVDFETTGLDCDVDRIVEIGLVKFTADGTVLDEFATLVNSPGSGPQARAGHQIDDADVVGAPNIADVLREAFAFMSGTVLVAHHFDFENGFLAAAAKQASIPLPDVLGLCTLRTARRQLDGRAYSLTVMYKTASGEFPTNRHTALGDARCVREVLLWLLNTAPQPLHLTSPPPKASISYVAGACQIKCRHGGVRRSSDLLTSFPQSPNGRAADAVELKNYQALLAALAEDGHRTTFDEAVTLAAQAGRTGFTGTQLRRLHRKTWEATFSDVKDTPWVALDPSRRDEMYRLADDLGLADLAAEIHDVIESCAEPPPPKKIRYLRGMRIGISGDNEDLVTLRERAEEHGVKIAVIITQTVRWLATTTPHAIDVTHDAARSYRIPMLTPADAVVRLEADLADAIRESKEAEERKERERKSQADEWARERQRRDDERDAYWRPTWRTVELVDDPGPRKPDAVAAVVEPEPEAKQRRGDGRPPPAARHPKPASAAVNTDMETLICFDCGARWQRPRSRGRRPGQCPGCMAKNSAR